MKKELETFLKKLIQNQKIHGKWLNTLAFMEHIGSRKIIKSQDSATLNRNLLEHISEEARHAVYFKHFSQRVSPNQYPTFEEKFLLDGESSEDYFQAIDRQVAEVLHSNKNEATLFLNYLYTTWLIEERAMLVYKIYNKILKENHFPFNLHVILQEEDHHLKTVLNIIEAKDSHSSDRKKIFATYEEKQFTDLVKKWQAVLEQELSVSPSNFSPSL